MATFKSHMQKVAGSNPTQTTDPERSALRIPLGLRNLLTRLNDQETVIEGKMRNVPNKRYRIL